MLTVSQAKEKESRVLIACRVMEPELEMIRKEVDGIEVRYLEQGLHDTPQKMPGLIQEQIDRAAEYAGQIVLGYGLCSNGIVGVTARKQGLFVPRCHDCISFFFGSIAAYQKAFEARPGTYYLTPGMIAHKVDPLSIIEERYIPRLGLEKAIWAMEEQLKHYTHITLINTGVGDLVSLRERALENAKFLKKEYAEVRGSLNLFSKIIRGFFTEDEFFLLGPGEKVTQGMFL